MLNYLLAGTGSPAATIALALIAGLALAFGLKNYALRDDKQVVYFIQTPDRQGERVGQ